MTPFEQLVLEKLSVIERRITGIESQMTLLANVYTSHNQRLTELENRGLQQAVTPIPFADSEM